jgi:hypothetical protein
VELDPSSTRLGSRPSGYTTSSIHFVKLWTKLYPLPGNSLLFGNGYAPK